MKKCLFHALHDNGIHSPSIKEFKECWAFCNTVRNAFKLSSTRNDKSAKRSCIDVVIDVAGGHGALAAMFLICTSAQRAVVVDPANVGGGGVKRAWAQFLRSDQIFSYRYECLRSGLPSELQYALQSTQPDKILVVACHACSHLSEEIINIACSCGVHVAVMPCCQRDFSPGMPWKATSKTLSIPVAYVIDLLQCGKIMSRETHEVRMKFIDPAITPQNRIIVCKALPNAVEKQQHHHNRQSSIEEAHAKLKIAYRKAHAPQRPKSGIRKVVPFPNPWLKDHSKFSFT